MTEGIHTGGVTTWLAARLDLRPPLTFRRLPGGRSNLTYEVGDAQGRRWVLRRPPLGRVLATAHDVTREARILAALRATPVPVPAILAVCDDPAVTGAPFVVMELVGGTACHTPEDVGGLLTPPARRAAAEALTDVLATLHAVDPDAVGLGDLGRRDGYVARQLTRWHGQWERDRVRALDAIGRAHDLLAHAVPAQRATALVHGDYRLDNCLLTADGTVTGVLDWEICTRGDPRADLGLLLAYWAQPGDEVTALAHPPTRQPGFPTRAELRDRYLAVSGTSGEAIDFFEAFGWWKIACIVEGVYTRTRRGALGATDRSPESFGEQAAALAERAWELASRLPAAR